MSNDNVNVSIQADYKVYELRQSISDLIELADKPCGRRIIAAEWETLYKSHAQLAELLNRVAPND